MTASAIFAPRTPREDARAGRGSRTTGSRCRSRRCRGPTGRGSAASDGQTTRMMRDPVRHAPLRRWAGRREGQVGGDPHEAAGYLRGSDEQASAPAVCRGVRARSGTARPRRPRRPGRCPRRRAGWRRRSTTQWTGVPGAAGVGSPTGCRRARSSREARRRGPSTPGTSSAGARPPPSSSPAASRLSVSRARRGTTSSRVTRVQPGSSTERTSERGVQLLALESDIGARRPRPRPTAGPQPPPVRAGVLVGRRRARVGPVLALRWRSRSSTSFCSSASSRLS